MHFGQNEKSNECGSNFPKRTLYEQMAHVPDTDTDVTHGTERSRTKQLVCAKQYWSTWRKQVSEFIIGTL